MNKRELDEVLATRSHFQEHKIYTKLPVGSPSYRSFWEEERKRCLEGYHIGSDYITGYFYHYLNYSPITILEDDPDNKLRANEVIDFPKFWELHKMVYDYIEESENAGEHSMFWGSRGKSKSWIGASMLTRNYFHIERSKSYAIAHDYQFLLEDGILSPKTWSVLNFIDENTPWGKRRQFYDTKLHKKSSYKVRNNAGLEIEKGWQSEIMGFSVKDDVDKFRGKRGKLAIIEEAGNLPDLEQLIRLMLPSYEQGSKTRGLILLLGTGGTTGEAGQGIINVFKNPKASRIHAVKNKWSKGQEHLDVGFFAPRFLNWEGAYNELGVSDIPLAEKLFEERYGVLKTSGDPFAYVKLCAEFPSSPEDAMAQISGTQYPIRELRIQEAEIETHPAKYRNAEFHVKFELNRETQKYEWKTDLDAKPIYEFPHFDNKGMPGAIIIYEHPKEDEKNEVYPDRYIFSGDSYDFDESSTASLGSLFIMDTWTERIVAEYTGRPKAFEFYENCRRLILYYNAKGVFESMNKGVFDYFDAKSCGYLIMDEPRIVREAVNEPVKTNTRKRGIMPSKPLYAYARGLAAQWLLESTNNSDKPEEIKLHQIKCLPLIRELIFWNSEGNFDRQVAFHNLILLLHEKKKYMVDGIYQIPKNYLGNDPYFDKVLKNYNKRFGSFV